MHEGCSACAGWPCSCSKAQVCVEDVEEIVPEKLDFGALSHHIRLLHEGLKM